MNQNHQVKYFPNITNHTKNQIKDEKIQFLNTLNKLLWFFYWWQIQFNWKRSKSNETSYIFSTQFLVALSAMNRKRKSFQTIEILYIFISLWIYLRLIFDMAICMALLKCVLLNLYALLLKPWEGWVDELLMGNSTSFLQLPENLQFPFRQSRK
jgi:hypothetical protein